MTEYQISQATAVLDATPEGALENLCLRGLQEASLSLIAPHLFPVTIERDQRLDQSEHASGVVLFPVSGIVSVVYGNDDGDAASIAMIGNEGIANYHLLFPQPSYPYNAVGHVAGMALAMKVDTMRGMLLTSRELRSMFYHFGAKLHLQIAATLRASLKDPIEKRLARCLLMHHDRIGEDDIAVYHSTVADMLGVRRASITDAMHRLEGLKAIRDTRGQTRICNRTLLGEIAGSSYGAAEQILKY